ncbi:MAG: hypothetical protein COB17_01785 [Sulfurimonas sp.]|nr:MAG: hypothetical protein COB17_01785 [Sulfurimonas sp.]
MEYITLFFNALYDLSNAMSPYILFGLAFAGVLHELVPDSIVTKHLGKESISSVIKSTIFGIPLPVCSCGVIPLATSIKKSGASKGATLSFLISTPITGVDSILATFGIFGWIFTIYRVLTSMLIAMLAGILTNIFDKETNSEDLLKTGNSFSIKNMQKPKFTQAKPAMSSFGIMPNNFSLQVDSNAPKSCCSSTKEETSSCYSDKSKKSFSFFKAMSYAFGTLLGDISKPLLWGLIIGALITVYIPDNLSDLLKEYPWVSYIIVIAIAVPMYVCATASLPIAAGLMLSGVSAGAAFVFLSAGPATNTVTIGVVKKMLGTKSLYIYLSSIILGSLVFGLGLDYIFNINDIDTATLIHLHKEASIIDILSSLVLWIMVLYFVIKPYFKK